MCQLQAPYTAWTDGLFWGVTGMYMYMLHACHMQSYFGFWDGEFKKYTEPPHALLHIEQIELATPNFLAHSTKLIKFNLIKQFLLHTGTHVPKPRWCQDNTACLGTKHLHIHQLNGRTFWNKKRQSGRWTLFNVIITCDNNMNWSCDYYKLD